MDQILSCTNCRHAIGLHTADGCSHYVRLREGCACAYTAGDVIEETLRKDEIYRASLLDLPFVWAPSRS